MHHNFLPNFTSQKVATCHVLRAQIILYCSSPSAFPLPPLLLVALLPSHFPDLLPWASLQPKHFSASSLILKLLSHTGSFPTYGALNPSLATPWPKSWPVVSHCGLLKLLWAPFFQMLETKSDLFHVPFNDIIPHSETYLQPPLNHSTDSSCKFSTGLN